MQIPGSQSLGFLFNTIWVKQWYLLWDIWQIKCEKSERQPIINKAMVRDPSFYPCITFYLWMSNFSSQ